MLHTPFKLLLFCVVVLLVCDAGAKDVKKYVSRDFTFLVYNSGEQSLEGKAIAAVNDHERSVDSIVVIRKRDNKRVQKIVPEENSYTFNSTVGNDPLTVEDMNFDGVADISIRQFLPAGPNIPYFCWVFDARRGIFVEDRQLEEITSAIFDQKSKTIVLEWRSGAGSYGASTYQYIGSKLTLVKEVTKTAAEDNGDMITVTKVLVNGRMKEMSKTRSEKWD